MTAEAVLTVKPWVPPGLVRAFEFDRDNGSPDEQACRARLMERRDLLEPVYARLQHCYGRDAAPWRQLMAFCITSRRAVLCVPEVREARLKLRADLRKTADKLELDFAAWADVARCARVVLPDLSGLAATLRGTLGRIDKGEDPVLEAALSSRKADQNPAFVRAFDFQVSQSALCGTAITCAELARLMAATLGLGAGLHYSIDELVADLEKQVRNARRTRSIRPPKVASNGAVTAAARRIKLLSVNSRRPAKHGDF